MVTLKVKFKDGKAKSYRFATVAQAKKTARFIGREGKVVITTERKVKRKPTRTVGFPKPAFRF